MHIRFTNTDSAGDPVTKRIYITHDGEIHAIDLSSGGTAEVSDAVGEYLIESDDYAVESDENRFGTEFVEETEGAAPEAVEETDNEV